MVSVMVCCGVFLASSRFETSTSFFTSLFIQEAIFRVVAAILHLGNVEFTTGKEADSSIPKDEKSKFHLSVVAELLRFVTISNLN